MICSNSTHTTSRSCLSHSREPCKWVDADLEVLWARQQNVAGSSTRCNGAAKILPCRLYQDTETWGSPIPAPNGTVVPRVHSPLLAWVFENCITALSIWKPLCRVKCPCPEQGQNLNSELSSAIFVPILPTYINNNIFQKLITIFSNLTEPEDHDQTIHRVPVNRLIVILRFYG